MNDVPVVEVSRCGFARGTLLGEHVVALILRMMAGDLLKMVSNWAGLTRVSEPRFPWSELKICVVG